MRRSPCLQFDWWLPIFLFAVWPTHNGWAQAATSGHPLAGLWQAQLESPGGPLRFGIRLKQSADGLAAQLLNGDEAIDFPSITVDQERVALEIDHYDSKLEFVMIANSEGTIERLQGTWKKRRGPDLWVEMKWTAVRAPHRESSTIEGAADARKPFLGRWAVKFSGSQDPAVGLFSAAEHGRIAGTFLTTTGDYRFLDGMVVDGTLQLSCFDGAHAFLFHARHSKTGGLDGDFWSSDTWHETWTATADPDAQLPDSFRQTLVNQQAHLGDFSFPDVDGKLVNLDAPQFHGKARIVYVFGSWCPNCHDAAGYFAELESRYADKGLSILGIAFELTGDFQRDAGQVRKYLQRHGCTYPVVIAGMSDKQQASKTFPLLDRIRSYPTTIFIDRDGKIVAVHTGFSGPATGKAYDDLKREFESRIEVMLKD